VQTAHSAKEKHGTNGICQQITTQSDSHTHLTGAAVQNNVVQKYMPRNAGKRHINQKPHKKKGTTMIEKLKPLEGLDHSWLNKINELCDAVNELDKHLLFLRRKVLEITYKEPDQYKSITFMSDGHIKKFYGHDSIVELEVPLPQGTKITIRSIAKGGGNE
jgi:hypothetical protein